MNKPADLDIPDIFHHTAADHNDALKARMLARTIGEQVRMTGVVPRVGGKDRKKARNVFEGLERLGSNPSPGTLTHLAALIGEFDREIVMDAARIRNYVTNKLLALSTDMDPKVQLRALEMLGKITDVALFSEKRELTISTNDQEVVQRLRERLKRLAPIDVVMEDASVLSDDDEDDADPAGTSATP